MRLKLSHIFCFLICFTLEVKIKAQDVLEEPLACLTAGTGLCALQADGQQFDLEKEGFSFSMSSGSIISRESAEKRWRFVAGTLWVRALPANTELHLDIGKIKSTSKENLSFWVIGPTLTELGHESWIIRVVEGEAGLTRQDGSGLVTLPAGFEISLQGYSIEGELIRSVARPIDFEEHLKLWGTLHTGTKAELLSAALQFQKLIRSAIEASSVLYNEVVERKIAAIQEQEAKKRRLRAQREAERQEVLRLFRKRNYLDHLD